MLEILDLVFPNLIIQAMIKAFIRYLQTAALKVTLSIRTLCRSHTQIIFNLLVILSSIVVLALDWRISIQPSADGCQCFHDHYRSISDGDRPHFCSSVRKFPSEAADGRSLRWFAERQKTQPSTDCCRRCLRGLGFAFRNTSCFYQHQCNVLVHHKAKGMTLLIYKVFQIKIGYC